MQKINLDEFIDDMSFACSQYRTKIKHQLLEFSKQLLELAAENANLSISSRGADTYFSDFYSAMDDVEVNQQSILDTIKQVE